MAQLYNFSGSVGTFPLSVIEEVQRGLRELPGVGISILGLSHRSNEFNHILEEAEENLRRLLGIPGHYRVLFLQGGASLQFSMIPINLLRSRNRPANYIVTGYWSQKPVEEGKREGRARVVWDGSAEGFVRTPRQNELDVDSDAVYLHYCSNETVEGVQFAVMPEAGGVPLICDMSSDFLSQPFDIERYALVYAHAQKNLGPSGLTVVVIREDLLNDIPDGVHTMLDYRPHVQMRSVYNTPPIFCIYTAMLMTRWLLHDVGGLEHMARLNLRKAPLIYDVIDQSRGFYRGHARPESRSLANVVFHLSDASLENRFLADAKSRGLLGLNGHRSLGGMRASFYNPMPVEGAHALRDFMLEFAWEYRKP